MQFSLAAREWLVGCMWDGKQRLCRADHYEERKRAAPLREQSTHTHMHICIAYAEIAAPRTRMYIKGRLYAVDAHVKVRPIIDA
jgi:hypothetical protein